MWFKEDLLYFPKIMEPQDKLEKVRVQMLIQKYEQLVPIHHQHIGLICVLVQEFGCHGENPQDPFNLFPH